MITKIISGGQTGADQGGLAAGKELGIKTGGIAPPNFLTEDGVRINLLRDYYGLVEGQRDRTTYTNRTRRNILDSDGTVIFGDIKSPGSRATKNICESTGKPWIHNPGCLRFLKWVVDNSIGVLNVAGNRESKSKGIQEKVYKFLVTALKEF